MSVTLDHDWVSPSSVCYWICPGSSVHGGKWTLGWMYVYRQIFKVTIFPFCHHHRNMFSFLASLRCSLFWMFLSFFVESLQWLWWYQAFIIPFLDPFLGRLAFFKASSVSVDILDDKAETTVIRIAFLREHLSLRSLRQTCAKNQKNSSESSVTVEDSDWETAEDSAQGSIMLPIESVSVLERIGPILNSRMAA